MARRSAAWYVYAGSIALHAALGIAAIAAPSTKRHQAVAIALAETKKPKKEPKDDKPPPPPPPPPPAARAKVAAAPKPAAPPPPTPTAAPPPAAAPAFADLGLTLGNGGGGPGLAVPQRAAAAAPTHAPASTATTTRKVTTLAPVAEETCDEPLVKPKPRSIVKPAYTEDARAAQVEGVVRVEITIDPTGQVVDAKILRGLGHGLDEAALAAARQMTFEPGMRCGKAHVATISLGVRFALGS